MSDRFTLLYRFSTDYGLTWTDLTPQVDSRQTVITQNLCTNNFTSAKDEATFVLPETPLFDAGGNATPKKLLIDALMGNDDILIEINAPGSVDVLWDGDDVLWNGEHVQWRGSVRYFTGYADRSSMDLRSYPLPPRLTVKVQDVSVLHLDDKVDRHVLLENNKISQIVSALLGYAGYVDIGNTSLDNSDDETLEAFVIDKDKARTYRQYIDDLLFEAGGYVLDFNESGQANVIHLQWDGSASASRTIDNPMNSDGVTLKGAWLKEDGVKVRWSSLAWAYGERIWQADISQEIDSGVLVGETVHSGRYWPDGGELDPVYMEYDAKLLDSEYLTRASRRENKDLTVIMAKNMSARIDAMQNGSPFTGWTRVDPTSWPAGDNWNDKYGIPTNPAYWPTKAWHLLYNGTGSDVSLTFFALYGDVLYRDRVNTVEMQGAKNPKEYESTYIYNQTHAERFAQFWWHFLQTSRYQFTWSEPNRRSPLNDIVAVGVKGNGSTQKALIAGKTHRWINDNVEIISYTAVGIDTYSPSSLVPISIVPSSSKPQKQPTTGAKTATFSTTPSYTLAQWESFGTPGMAQTWTVTNASAFSAGDIAVINGTISDMDIPVKLFMDVTGVDTVNGTISGNGIEIRYVPVTAIWDFDIEQNTAVRNDRITYSSNDPRSYTEIKLKSLQSGHGGVLEYWTCTGTAGKTFFTGDNQQTTTGSEPRIRITTEETVEVINVTMYDPNDPSATITKQIRVINQTEYDHDFGLWKPQTIEGVYYQLPDHFDDGTGYWLDIAKGDYFVAQETFTVSGDTYTEGVPYTYKSNSWHNPITATTTDDAGRLLHCLGNVLGSSAVQPSTSALYGWFQNLVAKNAVIDNLFSQAITVLSGGYIKGGDRYSSSGTISDWSKKGFWFGADGTLMASLQSDGNGNTYVGTSVGANSNSPGSYNTAVGYAAMFKTTSGGDYNIALGYAALYENQTGDNNIAIGYQALYHNTASDNIGIGTNALMNNTSGTYNIGIGYNSLYINPTGNYNVAIGYEALKINYASNNIAIGYHSLATNGAGGSNIAIGIQAMVGNTSGNNNVALGNNALSANWLGSNNISIGQLSMQANDTGSSNIGIGHAALRFNTTGGGNIAFGHDVSCYSATGYRQMNINNAIICLEFKAGRTYSQVYTALKSYFANTTDKAGCIGIVDGDYASRIEVIDSSKIRVYGGSYHDFTNSSSTLTKRMVLFFVNPKLISDTSNDCIT